MATPDHPREPCPDRILDDIGGAFAMGAIGGSVFHFVKGVYNSPRGERLLGGAQGVRMNAPRVGGSFAVWGGLFSVFDCSMVYLRQKEDPWNSIIAGAATGGFLQLRAGPRSSARSALIGGGLLALIEGLSIMASRLMQPPPPPPLEDAAPFPSMPHTLATAGAGDAATGPAAAAAAAAAGAGAGAGGAAPSSNAGAGGWLGGWFGSSKPEPKKHQEKLESFDATTSAPPIPGFELK